LGLNYINTCPHEGYSPGIDELGGVWSRQPRARICWTRNNKDKNQIFEHKPQCTFFVGQLSVEFALINEDVVCLCQDRASEDHDLGILCPIFLASLWTGYVILMTQGINLKCIYYYSKMKEVQM
jgi:hypothetical protein